MKIVLYWTTILAIMITAELSLFLIFTAHTGFLADKITYVNMPYVTLFLDVLIVAVLFTPDDKYYTQKQFDDAKEIAQGHAYLYYLNVRRVDLTKDMREAVRWHRHRTDIESRLKATTTELMRAENAMGQ